MVGVGAIVSENEAVRVIVWEVVMKLSSSVLVSVTVGVEESITKVMLSEPE